MPLARSDEAALIDLHRSIAEAGLVRGSSGNASFCEVGAERTVWIKASGARCAQVTEEDLVPVNLRTGRILSGTYSPSTDLPLHMCIYNVAESARFVVHTHSFYAALFSIYGETLHPYVTGTAELFDNGVPCLVFSADRAILATRLEAIVSTGGQACLLERHGALVWGNSWSQALNFAELLEWSARMAVEARLAGLSAMSSSQIVEYNQWYKQNYQPV